MSFSSQQPYEANLEESGWGMQNHFRGYWSLLFPFPTLGFCHGVVALWHLLKPASEEMTPWYLLTCREDFKHGRFPWEQEGAALWETELTWMKTTMKQFSYGNNPGLQWSCECSTVQPCLPRALLCFIQGSAPAPPSLQLTAWVPGRADPAAIPQGTWCLWHGVVKAPWKGTLLPSGSGFNASITVPEIISAKIKAAKLGGETVLASVMLFKIRENLHFSFGSWVKGLIKTKEGGCCFLCTKSLDIQGKMHQTGLFSCSFLQGGCAHTALVVPLAAHPAKFCHFVHFDHSSFKTGSTVK